jgi:hypothetical protein
MSLKKIIKEVNKMRKTTKILMVFAIVLNIIATIALGGWLSVRIVKAVQFNMNCTQYIKRAADASTVETAKEELAKAISYVAENNLTEGIVSIYFHQPKNDVGYWYKNLTEAYNELDTLPEDATSLEKTNVLMKLRETLTDEKESEVSVTIPEGISIYPHNVFYFWWSLLSYIFCFGSWIIIIRCWNDWD